MLLDFQQRMWIFRKVKAIKGLRGGGILNSAANFRETKVDSFSCPEGEVKDRVTRNTEDQRRDCGKVAFRVSRMKVTGPSLTSDTFISAWKMPVCTGMPSSQTLLTKYW